MLNKWKAKVQISPFLKKVNKISLHILWLKSEEDLIKSYIGIWVRIFFFTENRQEC